MISRLAIEAIGALALIVGIALFWWRHDVALEKIGIEKQVTADVTAAKHQADAVALIDSQAAQRIQEANANHAIEIAAANIQYRDMAARLERLQRSAVAPNSGSVPEGSRVSDTQTRCSGSAASGNAMHPDQSDALRLFAFRLATVEADARALNNAVHGAPPP